MGTWPSLARERLTDILVHTSSHKMRTLEPNKQLSTFRQLVASGLEGCQEVPEVYEHMEDT